MRVENVKITSQILKLISQIDEFKGYWKAVSTSIPNRLHSIKKEVMVDSIGSSLRIEGTNITDSEVKKIINGPKPEKITSKEQEGIFGYCDALNASLDKYCKSPLSETSIKELHQTLFKHSITNAYRRGQYKRIPNYIDNFDIEEEDFSLIFKKIEPFEIPKKMQELVKWYLDMVNETDYHPLLIIGIFFATFLNIYSGNSSLNSSHNKDIWSSFRYNTNNPGTFYSNVTIENNSKKVMVMNNL